MPATAADLQAVFEAVKPLIAAYVPPLTATRDEPGRYDTYSVKPLEIAGRKRDGIDFAAIVIQKSFVGFYFMPVYGSPELMEKLHPGLRKTCKGKACFHIKSADDETLAQIADALRIGFEEYRARRWVAADPDE